MALARLRTPDAYAELTKALARPSAADSMAAAACAALAELGDARDPEARRRHAPGAQPAAADRGDDRARHARRHAAAGAREWMATARGRAARARAPGVGRAHAGPPFRRDRARKSRRALRDRDADDDDRQRRRGLGGVRAVTARRKLRGQGETSTADLKQRIEKLAEENKALETRLKALEASTPRAPAVPQ